MAYRQTSIIKKHTAELEAFKKKAQSKIDSLKKQRVIELEKLLQKYQNIKKDLEIQNGLELKKLQMRKGNQCSTSYNKSGS